MAEAMYIHVYCLDQLIMKGHQDTPLDVMCYRTGEFTRRQLFSVTQLSMGLTRFQVRQVTVANCHATA